MRVDVSIIDHYNDTGASNVLAAALLIKSFWRNSTIYQYQSRQAIKSHTSSLGVCKNTYLKYCDVLVRNGHARIHSGNLTITRLHKKDKTKEEDRSFITIDRHIFRKNTSMRQAKENLDAIMLRRYCSQQVSVIHQKFRANKRMNPSNLDELKMANRAIRSLVKAGYEMNLSGGDLFPVDENVSFKISTLTQLMHVSKGRLYKAIARETSRGNLVVGRRFTYLGKVKDRSAEKYGYGMFISKTGSLYAVSANTYTFSSLPIQEP